MSLNLEVRENTIVSLSFEYLLTQWFVSHKPFNKAKYSSSSIFSHILINNILLIVPFRQNILVFRHIILVFRQNCLVYKHTILVNMQNVLVFKHIILVFKQYILVFRQNYLVFRHTILVNKHNILVF